ncbi:hypothetical protein EHN65_24160 [Salmonella enterica]|nr:hypothetical protein [Salmonella enterica]
MSVIKEMNEYEIMLESLTVDEKGEFVHTLSELNENNKHAKLNNLMMNISVDELHEELVNNNQIEDIPETINKNPLAKSMMQTFKENMNIFKPLSARNGLSKEQALNKICNDFSFLESEEFKGIFDNYYKNGKKVTISLNTGSKITIDKNRILKERSEVDPTMNPDLKLEVKTMLALAVERNMNEIKISGKEDHVKETFRQAYELNKILPKEKQITIYPHNKEQRLLFEGLARQFEKSIDKDNESDINVNNDLVLEQASKKKLKM